MSYFNQIMLVDTHQSRTAKISPFEAIKVAEASRLVGGNLIGTTLDTRLWQTTLANGGTYSQSGGQGTLATNTGQGNGSAILRSKRVARFLSGNPNFWIGGVRLVDGGQTGNTRRWGISNGTDGLFFELVDNTIGVVALSEGVPTRVTVLNGESAFVLDTNYHFYEIDYSAGSATFFQDRVRIHTITTSTAPICADLNLPISLETVNSGGATVQGRISGRGLATLRFGRPTSAPMSARYTSSETDIVLKRGPGTLHRVNISAKGTGGATITIRDGVDGSGTIIDVIDVVNFQGTMDYGVNFDVGLTYTTSANAGNGILVWD